MAKQVRYLIWSNRPNKPEMCGCKLVTKYRCETNRKDKNFLPKECKHKK
jgi:hypothetical protein